MVQPRTGGCAKGHTFLGKETSLRPSPLRPSRSADARPPTTARSRTWWQGSQPGISDAPQPRGQTHLCRSAPVRPPLELRRWSRCQRPSKNRPSQSQLRSCSRSRQKPVLRWSLASSQLEGGWDLRQVATFNEVSPGGPGAAGAEPTGCVYQHDRQKLLPARPTWQPPRDRPRTRRALPRL